MRRFQVALSFPSEHRDRVEKIAEALAARLGRENEFRRGLSKRSRTLFVPSQSIESRTDCPHLAIPPNYDKLDFPN